MAKKKTEELDVTTEAMLSADQSAPVEEIPEAPSEADMDLNELLKSLDAPDEPEIAEAAPDDAPQPLDGSPPDDMTDDAGLSEKTPIADAPVEDLPDEPAAAPAEDAQKVKSSKRPARKKKAPEPEPADSTMPENMSKEAPALQAEDKAEKPTRERRTTKKTAPILTLEAKAEVETQENIEDAIWHEIHNAYRTRRILTGMLGGIEQLDNGKTVALVDYKGFRIVIPLKEMVINFPNNLSGNAYNEMVVRQHKILSNMLGAEIDFVVKGIDSKTRSAVASRKEAMLKKRQLFYLNTDASGMYRIYDERIIQARVIAVAEKVIRIEAFGVECSILARDLSWDWIGDAHDRFSVGDQVLVRVLSVNRNGLEDISIKADVKSVSENNSHDNLKKCRIQSKYAGKVTDVHKGVVYIRLTNGVNAIAHSCYDRRMPGKKDDVSFAVTHIDEERGVAVGIITRIIKQNL
jgi:predicted RNA-binding protein with RPS1 domain